MKNSPKVQEGIKRTFKYLNSLSKKEFLNKIELKELHDNFLEWVQNNCEGFRNMKDFPKNWDEKTELYIKINEVQYLLDLKKMDTFPQFVQNYLKKDKYIKDNF